jgi:hypothetical protein
MVEGVNSRMIYLIYCKNFLKCHNVSPLAQQLKKRKQLNFVYSRFLKFLIKMGSFLQIKTTLRFHLTPVRIATIKNTTTNKCWQGYKKKGPLMHCWWKCKLVQALWKTIWKLLKT